MKRNRLFERYRKISQNKRRRGGFTLVELVVVLAVLAILASFSAAGLLGYTKNAIFRKNNQHAETIFNAAQSALTYYRASGKLTDFRMSVQEIEAGSERGSSAYPKFVPDEVLPEKRKGLETSYLLWTKNTGKTLASSLNNVEAIGTEEEQLLFDMLRDYVTEAGIYDASICVEFDVTDGVVCSVLYSDREDAFAYDESAGLNIGKAKNREESERRESGLGYYGGDTKYQEPQNMGELEIGNVILQNAETLDLIWYLKDAGYQKLSDNLEYTIELAETDGENQGKRKACIKLTPDSSSNSLGLAVNETDKALVKAKVTLYGYENGAELTEEIGEMPFHAYKTVYKEGEKINTAIVLTLDAVDSYLAAAQYEAVKNGKMEIEDTEIQSTYSARRLSLWKDGKHYGLELDDAVPVRAEVTAANVEASKTSQPKTSNSANLLFAEPAVEEQPSGTSAEAKPIAVKTGKGTDAEYTYGIENARHLYNVRFRETDTHYQAKNVTYELRKNIAWGGVGENNTLKKDLLDKKAGDQEISNGLLSFTAAHPEGGALQLAAGDVYTKFFYKGTAISGQEGEQVYPAFPSILKLNETSALKSAEQEKYALPADDKRFTISNLALEADGNIALGGGEGTTGEPAAQAMANVGLVQLNQGTISELKLKDADVRGIKTLSAGAVKAADNVGAFCGTNGGTLTNLETVGGEVCGGTNVGGIVGAYSEEAAGTTQKNLVNEAAVSGLKNVGGIAGSTVCIAADQTASSKTVSISDCTNTGMVYGWSAAASAGDLQTAEENYPQNIGGITGYAGAGTTLSNCISAPVPKAAKPQEGDASDDGQGDAAVLSEEELMAKYGHGDCVGGLVGYAEQTTAERFSNCRVENGYVVGRDYVGGAVGWQEGSSSDASAAVQDIVVKGRHFVGGFAGVSMSIKVLDNLNDRTIKPTSVDGECYVGGYIGGGFWDIKDSQITTGIHIENMLPCSKVSGTAFVGGLIGMDAGWQQAQENLSLSETVKASADKLAEDAEKLTAVFENAEPGMVTLNGDVQAALEEIMSLDAAVPAENMKHIQISGTEAKLADDSEVSGSIFVGGLFGYMTPGSWRDLRNIEIPSNLTVTASHAVTAFGKLLERYEKTDIYESDKAYSFSGGMTGYLTRDTRVENCSSKAAVVSQGTYMGSLAEINEGTIAACKAASFQNQNGGWKYVGGLVGINGRIDESTAGVLIECMFDADCRITGTGVTGGFAAENFGEISGPAKGMAEQTAKINAAGRYAGGIAGRNTETGIIENIEASVSVSSQSEEQTDAALNAGGIAGVNEGKIENCVLKSENAYAAGKLYAGGIAGLNEQTGVINNCSVKNARVQMSPNAGEALNEEGQKIETAIGLIAGRNNGVIYPFEANIGQDSERPALSIARADYAGTVAGINDENGQILVEKENQGVNIVYDLSDEDGPVGVAMGGIAGRNEGKLKAVSFCGNLTGNGSGKYYGGIAGVNSQNGIIQNCWLGKAAEDASIRLQAAWDNVLGGVAGYNTGEAALQGYAQRIESKSTVSILLTEKETAGETAVISALGGVIGMNDSTADMNGLSNGANFQIGAKSGSAGPVGGVIGLQKSGAESAAVTTLSKFENKTVWSIYSMGSEVGGIIGRIEAEKTAQLRLESFANNGSIHTEKNYAGGVIGAVYAQDSASITIAWAQSDFKDVKNQMLARQKCEALNCSGGIVGMCKLSGSAYLEISSSDSAMAVSAQTNDKQDGKGKTAEDGSGELIAGEETYTNGEYAGGMIGRVLFDESAQGAGIVLNACNTNEIGDSVYFTPTGQKYVGGLIGGVTNNGTATISLSGSENQRKVEATAGTAGGLIGKIEASSTARTNVSIEACKNKYSLDAKNGDNVGGLIGHMSVGAGEVKITDCINEAPELTSYHIEGANFIGGIIGRLDMLEGADISIQTCTNNMPVRAENQIVSGIIGYITGKGKAVITDCINKKEVTSGLDPYKIGAGIAVAAGSSDADVTFTNCVNAADMMYAGAGICTLEKTDALLAKVTIERCRNYGKILDPKNSGDHNAGIYAGIKDNVIDAEEHDSKEHVSIIHCIGIRNIGARSVAAANTDLGKHEDNLYYRNFENLGDIGEKESLGVVAGWFTGTYSVPQETQSGWGSINSELMGTLKWNLKLFSGINLESSTLDLYDALESQMQGICNDWPKFRIPVAASLLSEEPEETEPTEETEADVVLEEELTAPDHAALVPDWTATTGTDENGKEREAVSEEEFTKQLMLTASETEGAASYLMRAAFYTQMPEAETENMAPDPQYLLADENGEFNGEMPLAMNGSTYTFSGLPLSYAGKYLCVQFCSVSADGAVTSPWSDYIWLRLPRVALSAREVQTGEAALEYWMQTADEQGVIIEEETYPVTLTHPMLTWTWQKDTVSGEDVGYRISAYTLLERDVKTDSDTYKYPEMTVDLMKNEENGGYHLERTLTSEEKEDWKKEHPGEELPEYIHERIDIPEDQELYEKEHETDKKLKKAYSINLDEYALGRTAWNYIYEQTVEGVGTRTIEQVCAVLQILEYEDDYTQFRLILPDVEQQEAFLYDYVQVIKTQSVTIEALRQSRFAPANEALTAQKRQWVRLIRTDSMDTEGEESLLSLRRDLKPSEKFDEKFDPSSVDMAEAKEYELLPRNYAPELIWQSGAAAALAFMTDNQPETEEIYSGNPDAGEYYPEEIIFEDDTSVGFEDDTSAGTESNFAGTESESAGWTETNTSETGSETNPMSESESSTSIDIGISEELLLETPPETSSTETYGTETYSPETYSAETYSPETYSPETYSMETYSAETYSPETVAAYDARSDKETAHDEGARAAVGLETLAMGGYAHG